MLKNDMLMLTKKLYDDLLEMDILHEKILATNRDLIKSVEIENPKRRKKVLDIIEESNASSIENIAALKDIIFKTPDATKVIKYLIQRPLPELSHNELYILQHSVKHIDVKLMLSSQSKEVCDLGRVINYLQGNDPHKQLILSEIADSSSLMNLYHAAKQAGAESEEKRERAGSLESSKKGSPRTNVSLSRSLSSLRFSASNVLSPRTPRTPRTPRVEEIFELSSPSLHRKLEDIKLEDKVKSPPTKTKKHL